MKFSNYFYNYLKAFTNGNSFKILVLFSILINVCYPINIFAYGFEINYFEFVYYTLTNEYYIIILLILLILNTLNAIRFFDSNSMYIQRFKTKNDYWINLIKMVFISNFLYFLINTILLIIVSNLLMGHKVVVVQWENYNVLNYVYIIFYAFKLFFIYNLICILGVCFSKQFGLLGTVLYSVFICLPMLAVNNMDNTVYDLSSIPILPYYYLTKTNYVNFNLEFLSSVIYIIVNIFIIIFIFKIGNYFNKRSIDIG